MSKAENAIARSILRERIEKYVNHQSDWDEYIEEAIMTELMLVLTMLEETLRKGETNGEETKMP